MRESNPDVARAMGAETWAPIDPSRLEGVLTRRVFAYLVDFCIIGFLVVSAMILFFGVTLLSFGILSPIFGLLAVIPAAYHTLTIGLGGATWGQRGMGLLVTDMALQPPTLLQALVQTILFYLTVPTTGGLALLAVFFLPRRRALHDLLAGTQILRKTPPGGEILSSQARR